MCCNSWGHKESDTTEWLNWIIVTTDSYYTLIRYWVNVSCHFCNIPVQDYWIFQEQVFLYGIFFVIDILNEFQLPLTYILEWSQNTSAKTWRPTQIWPNPVDNTYIPAQAYFASETIFINVSWNFALFYQLEIILFLSRITHSK